MSTGSRRAVHVSRLLLANGDDFCLDRERGAGGIVLLALLLVPALVLALLASRLLRRRREGFSLTPPSLAGRSRVATGMDGAAAAASAVCFC